MLHLPRLIISAHPKVELFSLYTIELRCLCGEASNSCCVISTSKDVFVTEHLTITKYSDLHIPLLSFIYRSPFIHGALTSKVKPITVFLDNSGSCYLEFTSFDDIYVVGGCSLSIYQLSFRIIFQTKRQYEAFDLNVGPVTKNWDLLEEFDFHV